MADTEQVVRGLGGSDDPVAELIDALRQPCLPAELAGAESLVATMTSVISTDSGYRRPSRWRELRRRSQSQT